MVVPQDVSSTEYSDFSIWPCSCFVTCKENAPFCVSSEYESRRPTNVDHSLKVPQDSRVFGPWDWLYDLVSWDWLYDLVSYRENVFYR